jgi:very-short-patch-repair endonuclease
LRVTTPARTAVDLAAEMDLPEALMVLDAAARIELVAMSGSRHRAAYGDPRVLRAAVAPVQTALGSRARSSAQLRRAVSLVDVRRESPLESFSAGHFAQAGLPQPQLQARIRTPRGTYYADSLWPEQMLVGEADGAGKYEEADQVVREKLRDGALQDLGYAVLHWSGAEMFATPARVVQRAARVLAARGWDGVPVDW